MCGIFGLVGGSPLPPQRLAELVGLLRHRGPDAEHFWSDGPFQGGMRRLAINDVAGGAQPFEAAGGRFRVFYNGEIYNAPGLAEGLGQRGCRLRSHCDGEVVAHLFAEKGAEAFAELDGMYAIAVWDRETRRLTLARDPAGEKPLYTAALPGGGLAFASEIAPLRGLPGVDLGLDAQAIWDLPTFLWVPEPATIHRGIRALPPGAILVHDAAGRHQAAIPEAPRATAPDAQEIAGTLTAAIEDRLLSDVPLGCFLSGGLDSAIVTSVAARKLPGLATYSLGFDDVEDPIHGRADETPEAEESARLLGTDHRSLRITAAELQAALPSLSRHAGQPYAVSSALGVAAVAEAAAADGIKVLLSGDGADEAFGGYSWYAQLARLPAAPASRAVNGHPISFASVGLPLAQRLEALAAYSGPERAWAWHYYAAESDKAALFSTDLMSQSQSSLHHFAGAEDWEPGDFVANDRAFYLPNEMLAKVDRFCMAHGVEGRAPFVAPAVRRLAAALPFARLVEGDTLKAALRDAFVGRLPAEILSRPKHGFNVPVDAWLRGPWRERLAAAFAPGSALDRYGLVAPGAEQAALALADDRQRLNGHALLAFLSLDTWLDEVRP